MVGCGDVCATIEIMPVSLAERQAAGLGRDEPNRNPVLPPPVGLDLTQLMNPFYILRAPRQEDVHRGVLLPSCS